MDEITMFAELRASDTFPNGELADLRAELFPDLEPKPNHESSPANGFVIEAFTPHRRTGRPFPTRWVAAAAAAVLVAGLGVIASRTGDTPASTNPDGGTGEVPLPVELANELNPEGLADPVATVFGGLVERLLPAGYELVFASDDAEPLIVALNAAGDRFEAVVYSSESRRAELDRVSDELQLEVPEGVLAVGPDGQHDERRAYLVTDDAIVTADYVRVADPSTIQPGSAAEIARAIARDLPATLATGEDSQVGTGLFNDATAELEALASRIEQSGGIIRSTGAPTIEVTGDFASPNGPEPATVRVEMFNGFTAPDFLAARVVVDDARRQVARVGSWLVVVTVDGNVSEGSSALDALAVVTDVLTGSATPDSSTSNPAVTESTAAYTLLALDPPPAGYELSQARYLADAGGYGVARYTTSESSTQLHIVIRSVPLPVDTIESLNRETWNVDGRTVYSDGEANGCLPDVCSIGLQWDDQTYVSLMWVEPQGNDLAPGSDEASLLALLPNLIETDTDWKPLDDNPDIAGPDTSGDPAASIDAVPIVPGEVLVANATSTAGSAGRLTELLSAQGFTMGEQDTSTIRNQQDTIVYVRSGVCLGIQVAHAIGTERIETMPDVLPVATPRAVGEPDVLVVLGADIAEQLASEDFNVDIGPSGQLVVVDATDTDSILESYLSELDASGINVSDVVPARRAVTGTRLHPIGATTAWTCGTAQVIGIGGFDDWSPDLIDGALPDGTDAVLVVGN